MKRQFLLYSAFVVLVLSAGIGASFFHTTVPQNMEGAYTVEVAALPAGENPFETGFVTPASCSVRIWSSCATMSRGNQHDDPRCRGGYITRTYNHSAYGGACSPRQCQDNRDNDGDTLIDEDDPGCHSDYDASNPNSYVPTRNSEIEPLPDLVAQNLSLNGTAEINRLVDFTAEVRNTGGLSTGSGFDNEFSYRWNSGDPWTSLSTHSQGALTNGVTVSDTSSNFTLSQAGSLYVQYCVDINDEVPNESNESSNNCVTETYTVIIPPPDLEVSGLAPDSGELREDGDVTFSATTENNSTVSTGVGFDTKFYWGDRHPSSGTPIWTEFDSTTHGALAALGSLQDISTTITIDRAAGMIPSYSGNDYFVVRYCADPGGAVTTEVDTGNNCQVEPFLLVNANLTAEFLNGPSTLDFDTVEYFTVDVRNNGTVPVPSVDPTSDSQRIPYQIFYWNSTLATPGWRSFDGGDEDQDYHSGQILPGNTIQETHGERIRSKHIYEDGGQHFTNIQLCTDYYFTDDGADQPYDPSHTGRFAEFNENDNCISQIFQVELKNLTVSNLRLVNGTVGFGESVEFEADVSSTLDPLSGDPVFGDRFESDFDIWEEHWFAPIAGWDGFGPDINHLPDSPGDIEDGGNRTVTDSSTSQQIDDFDYIRGPAGSEYITVRYCADIADKIDEFDETDNCIEADFAVGATPTSTTPPPSTGPVSVIVEVQNTTEGSGFTTSDITIADGDEIEIRWTSSNASSCSFGNFDGDPPGGGATNGVDFTITEPAGGSNTTYTVQCVNGPDTANDQITVISTGAPPNISADDTLVPPNTIVDVHWDVGGNNPADCSVTGPGVDVTPTLTATGTEAVIIDAEATYLIDCGAGGSDSETIRLQEVIFET